MTDCSKIKKKTEINFNVQECYTKDILAGIDTVKLLNIMLYKGCDKTNPKHEYALLFAVYNNLFSSVDTLFSDTAIISVNI